MLNALDNTTEKFNCEYELHINKNKNKNKDIRLSIWSKSDEEYIFSEYGNRLNVLLEDGIRKIEEWFK